MVQSNKNGGTITERNIFVNGVHILREDLRWLFIDIVANRGIASMMMVFVTALAYYLYLFTPSYMADPENSVEILAIIILVFLFVYARTFYRRSAIDMARAKIFLLSISLLLAIFGVKLYLA
jgi:hypothetical protein